MRKDELKEVVKEARIKFDNYVHIAMSIYKEGRENEREAIPEQPKRG
jgi:hypothetical protein